VFAIPEMGRFYRHVLLGKRFPHHGAVAFTHCGKALFEVFKYLGIGDIGYNHRKRCRIPPRTLSLTAMDHTYYIREIRRAYEDYIDETARLEKDRRVAEGLMGLAAVPARTPAMTAFPGASSSCWSHWRRRRRPPGSPGGAGVHL
jgi:hypothetical protein